VVLYKIDLKTHDYVSNVGAVNATRPRLWM